MKSHAVRRLARDGWSRVGLTMLVCAVISILSFSDLWAKNPIKWKTIGPWEINVDQDLNYGCFLYTSYKGGTGLRFGFTHRLTHAFIMITDRDWRSLRAGERYPLVIQFDRKPAWSGEASGIRIRDVVALVLPVPIREDNFFVEFALSEGLHISHKGKAVANLTLQGSYAATQELLKCQKSMLSMKIGGTKSRTDPFSP